MVLDKDYIIELLSSLYSVEKLNKNQAIFISFCIENNIKLTEIFNSLEYEYLIIFESVIKNYNKYNSVLLKQKILDLFDEYDSAALVDIKKDLDRIFSGNHTLSYIQIEREYEKLLKYIYTKNAKEDILKLEEEFNKLDTEEILETFEKRSNALFQKYEKTVSFSYSCLSKESNVKEIFEKITKNESEIRSVSFIPYGRFIQQKRVGIFIAPTGVGKSHTLVACAADYLINAKKCKDVEENLIFLFTAENSEEETNNRILANILDIDSDKIRNASPEEYEKYEKDFFKKIKPYNRLLVIELEANIHTATSIQAIIDFFLKKYPKAKTHSIIIDYLDKLRSTRKAKDLREELGYITDELKVLAKTLNCPVITASQVNREGMAKAKKGKMELKDMGESWKKAENADIIIGIEEIAVAGENESLMRFKFFKHRYYKAGITLTLKLNKARSKYYFTGDHSEDITQNNEIDLSDDSFIDETSTLDDIIEKNNNTTYNKSVDDLDFDLNNFDLIDDEI